jgi:hypothetical protein
MKTLQIQDVPDDIVMRLQRLAEHYPPGTNLKWIYNKVLLTGLQFIEREVREIKEREES